jgi:amino acid permease
VHVKNSRVATIFLLLNTMIGSGILVQPYVFRESGLILAFFEYIAIGYLMYIGAEFLIKLGVSCNIYDYSHLAHSILGHYGSVAVNLSIVVTNAGGLLSYIIIIGSLFSDVVDTFSDCDDWYCNKGFLTVLPVLCFTVPLTLIRRFGHLAFISFISIFVIVLVMGLVFIGGPIRASMYDHDNDDSHNVRYGDFVGAMKTVGDIVFALGYVAALFHSYQAMETQSTKEFFHVTWVTTAIGTMMCFLMGLVGYACFLDSTETNILMNFPGPAGAIFKIFVIIHLLLYIPGDFVVFRASLWRLCEIDVQHQQDEHFIRITLASILTITVIAIILLLTVGDSTALSAVVNITGGVSGTLLYFIIPSACVYRLYFDPSNPPHRPTPSENETTTNPVLSSGTVKEDTEKSNIGTNQVNPGASNSVPDLQTILLRQEESVSKHVQKQFQYQTHSVPLHGHVELSSPEEKQTMWIQMITLTVFGVFILLAVIISTAL